MDTTSPGGRPHKNYPITFPWNRALADHSANLDPGSMAFGPYLKAMRKQMGVPLQGISRRIHVSERQLRLIEAEDHAALPDAIYVKGMLRAYAQCIGVDERDIVDRYTLNRSAYEDKLRSGNYRRLVGGKVFTRVGLSLGFLIVIVLLFYMVYGFLTVSFQAAGEKSPEIPDPKKVSTDGDVPTLTYSAVGNERLFLKIDAVEDTSLQIILDDEPPLEYLLHPMDHMEMTAFDNIYLRIGNAAGVKVFLNEKPVMISGESGQVVDMTLTHSN